MVQEGGGGAGVGRVDRECNAAEQVGWQLMKDVLDTPPIGLMRRHTLCIGMLQEQLCNVLERVLCRVRGRDERLSWLF